MTEEPPRVSLSRDDPDRTGMQRPTPALIRPRRGRMIAGVMAAIADRFGFDVTLVRVAYVVVSVLSAAFPGLIIYGLLWLVIPSE